MNPLKTLFVHCLLLAFLALFVACEHKELCDCCTNKAMIDVRFEWDKAPEAQPSSMVLYFYPIDGGAPIRRDLVGRDGGVVELPVGRYKVIAYNGDTEAVFFDKTDSWDAFRFFARTDAQPWDKASIANLPESVANEPCTLAPDPLWSARDADVQVRFLKDGDKQQLVFHPEPMLYHYTIEMRQVQNLKYVYGIGGALSGMARGISASTHQCLPPPVNVAYESHKVDATTISGSFYTFGHCPTVSNKHYLTVHAYLADNSKWFYHLDITAQVEAARLRAIEQGHPRRVHVVLDGLPFPKPIVNGSGLQPRVEEWQEDVYVDLDM